MHDERFERARSLIDEANSSDPNRVDVGEGPVPASLLYGQRMSAELESFAAGTSPLVQLAVRAQHIERWKIPRRSHPSGRRGYLVWRRAAAQWHAERLSEIARTAGYSSSEVSKLANIVRKAGARTDPDAQLVEDVACLVFLRHYLVEFAQRTDPNRLIVVLRKTWRKMSQPARDRALALPHAPAQRALLTRALGE